MQPIAAEWTFEIDSKDTDSPLEEYRREVYNCIKCGACQAVCPTYGATGDEALVARGRLSLLEAVLDGGLGLTRGLDERISSCIGCMACDSGCPSGIDIHGAVLAAMVALARGRGSHRLARMAARLAAHGSRTGSPLMMLLGRAAGSLYEKAPDGRLLPYWRQGSRRAFPALGRTPLSRMTGELSPAADATGRVALFAGCATSNIYPETGMAAITALNAAGLDVISPGSLECCGLPYLSLGDRESATRAAGNNLAALSRLDVDAVVTVCSSCALTLRELLPGLLGRGRDDVRTLAGSVRDIHELIADGLELPAREGPRTRVTYHDPCHMRHGLGLDFRPDETIGRLEGVQYIDAGEGCCGGAGVFSFLHYDLALKVGAGRAEEIAATGADVVVTGCPGCRAHLTDMLRRSGSKAAVMHTVELIAGS